MALLGVGFKFMEPGAAHHNFSFEQQPVVAVVVVPFTYVRRRAADVGRNCE